MKKFLLIVLLIAVMFIAVGCPFLISSQHTRAHAKAANNNMVEIHQFLDKHFWLYDWEDPYDN